MKFYKNQIKHLLSDSSGFSLIEMIIAIAIMSIICGAFAAATVSSTKVNLSNNERYKARGVAVTEIDNKLHPDKQYTASDGLDSVNIDLYLDDNSTPFDSKECYVVKKGGYVAYVKKSD